MNVDKEKIERSIEWVEKTIKKGDLMYHQKYSEGWRDALQWVLNNAEKE